MDQDGNELDLHAAGARVVGVFGPFGSRVMVEMPATLALRLFAAPLDECGPTNVIEAVGRDVATIAERDPALASSGLAASALALAREIEQPYNSATSKSMCARTLLDTLDRLRELAPVEEEADRLDDLGARRARRLAAQGPPAA